MQRRNPGLRIPDGSSKLQNRTLVGGAAVEQMMGKAAGPIPELSVARHGSRALASLADSSEEAATQIVDYTPLEQIVQEMLRPVLRDWFDAKPTKGDRARAVRGNCSRRSKDSPACWAAITFTRGAGSCSGGPRPGAISQNSKAGSKNGGRRRGLKVKRQASNGRSRLRPGYARALQ